jgi:hypothetical protein
MHDVWVPINISPVPPCRHIQTGPYAYTLARGTCLEDSHEHMGLLPGHGIFHV